MGEPGNERQGPRRGAVAESLATEDQIVCEAICGRRKTIAGVVGVAPVFAAA